MVSEYPEYRRRKQTKSRDSTTDGSKRLSALKEVVRCWGRDVVQHYWNQLRTTARRVPVWEEAVVGLNWSMLQRSRDIHRRPVKALVNSIEQADLDSLRSWSREDPFPCKKLAAEDLPDTFGFDKYGLAVGGFAEEGFHEVCCLTNDGLLLSVIWLPHARSADPPCGFGYRMAACLSNATPSARVGGNVLWRLV